MKAKHTIFTKKDNLKLYLIGSYFLFLGILAITRSLYKQMPFQLFYACYIGLILIGIGLLTKKSILVLSQIYILAIPLFIWTIDFLYFIIFKQALWGVTDYFFLDSSTWIDSFVTLQHLYTIPLSVYALKIMKSRKLDARKWSFLQLILMFILITVFSPPMMNINCVFSSCIDIKFGLPYSLVWFFGSFAMVEISYLVTKYFLFKK